MTNIITKKNMLCVLKVIPFLALSPLLLVATLMPMIHLFTVLSEGRIVYGNMLVYDLIASLSQPVFHLMYPSGLFWLGFAFKAVYALGCLGLLIGVFYFLFKRQYVLSALFYALGIEIPFICLLTTFIA